MVTLRETDYMARLVAYIKRNLAKGYSMDQLKLVLLGQGYSRSGVERAIRLVQAGLPKSPPPAPPAPAVVEQPKEEKKKNIFQRFLALFRKKKEK